MHTPANGNALALAEYLKRIRAASGLSFQLLSERSRVDVKYLHDLEHGRKARPSRDVLIRVGISMNLDLDDIDELLSVAGHFPLIPAKLSGAAPANGNGHDPS